MNLLFDPFGCRIRRSVGFVRTYSVERHPEDRGSVDVSAVGFSVGIDDEADECRAGASANTSRNLSQTSAI